MSSRTNATALGRASGCPSAPRMACIDIPEFLFQWMVGQQPDWAQQPLALVKNYKPTALLLEVNGRAQALGLRPGMRYAEALAQVPELQARPVPPLRRAEIRDEMVERLRAYSPSIEPCTRNAGVLYAALGGLLGLYPSWESWAKAVLQGLQRAGYLASVVLGFSRIGTLAVARSQPPLRFRLLGSPVQEEELAASVPLWKLGIPARLGQALQQLGVERLGPFLKLSGESLLERFGREAFEFHRRACNERWDPLQSQPEPHFWEARQGLEYGERDGQRLLLVCEQLLLPLLRQLYLRRRAVRRMHWSFHTSDAMVQHELGLTSPGLEPAQLLELLRLRLESQPPGQVFEVELWLEDTEGPPEQLELFCQQSRRELQAANRALDRLRAELGPEAVVQARLCEGHLPSASFRWEPLGELRGRPAPAVQGPQPCVLRRIWGQPQPQVAPRPEQRLGGPYRLSGGWWHREIQRDYYYVEGPRGELFWSYYDSRRRAWFREGRLE